MSVHASAILCMVSEIYNQLDQNLIDLPVNIPICVGPEGNDSFEAFFINAVVSLVGGATCVRSRCCMEQVLNNALFWT